MYLPTRHKRSATWLLALLLLLVLARSGRIETARVAIRDTRENGYHITRLPQISKAKEYHSPKKGLAAVYPHCQDAQMLGASWYYSWRAFPGACEGIETIPMLWCQTDGAVDTTSGWLLLFNEPDRTDQCNKTVAQVVAMVRAVETNPLYAGLKLVSPAYSHSAPNDLEQVRNLYRATYGVYPRWSAVAFHCYTETRTGLNLCESQLAHYTSLADTWGAELWLTEFAFVRGRVADADALAMTREWIELLEHNRIVARYAHFTNRLENGNYTGYRLIGDDGALNGFGELYRGY